MLGVGKVSTGGQQYEIVENFRNFPMLQCGSFRLADHWSIEITDHASSICMLTTHEDTSENLPTLMYIYTPPLSVYVEQTTAFLSVSEHHV